MSRTGARALVFTYIFPFANRYAHTAAVIKITTNHSVEDEYLQAIITEWQLYRQLMNEAPVIREMHLGGGTPTLLFACQS